MISKSEMKRVAVQNPMQMAEEYYKLQQENTKLKEFVSFVETWDPYPDLSSHKYYDAFTAIREKLDALGLKVKK